MRARADDWRLAWLEDPANADDRHDRNFLRQHVVRFPGGHVPSRPAEIAVLAVKAYLVFMGAPASDAEAAAGIVDACKSFDQALA